MAVQCMRDGTAVAYEAKLQKSSIGVPFLGAVVRAWKWIASTDEAPTRIRRNAFALYQKCWEPDVQQAAVAKHAEDGGLFAAEGKQRGIPVLVMQQLRRTAKRVTRSRRRPHMLMTKTMSLMRHWKLRRRVLVPAVALRTLRT